MIHFKGTDGFTTPEHNEFFNLMEEYALIDPDTLLLRHQYLCRMHFAALGNGPTSHSSVDGRCGSRGCCFLTETVQIVNFGGSDLFWGRDLPTRTNQR